ncbi:AAA domain protein [Orientia tsutsugamushi str. UT144]|uniref:AAA domain protein n=1 Tax=Orientia tsutsugamushi str. UT144 TaxID=1441384 RepID=A0A0F3RLI2_ORITS|nr:AAA family ATPase [Orientia tsutsugamushi]KJW07143.1 AAA domain protein [Orientia tsutsugamushi str. UT144]
MKKLKEVINSYFAKLSLLNRVDQIGRVQQAQIRQPIIRGLINEIVDNEVRREYYLKIVKDADVITDSITHYQSIFTKQSVEKEVKDIPNQIEREMLVQQVLSSSRVLELYHDDGKISKYFTTVEVRNEEARIIRDQVYYKDIYNLKNDIEGLTNVSEEQKQALKHILLSTSGVRVLRGRAGIGKSHVLAAVYKLAINCGQNIIGLAPTHKAVSELKSKGYKECNTIKGFLYNQRNTVTKDILIVVDKAGMVGTREYAELFKVVRNNNCQLILVGDERQLASVERGGMFEILANTYDSHVLTDVRKQSENWSREVAEKFAEGNILSGITLLKQNNCIEFADTLQDSMNKLIYDWSHSKCKLQEKLIITVRNKDIDKLNLNIRSLLKANSTLKGHEYSRSIAKKQESYMTGDRIVFQTSNKDLQIENSEFATLVSVNKNKFVAKTDTGKDVSFDPSKISFKHGYASTVYKAHGASIKDVYILHNGVSNISSSYTAMTRYVEKLRLYCNRQATESFNSLIYQISNPNDKSASITLKTAEDLKQEQKQKKTNCFSKICNWVKSIVTDINDRSHVNEEYYQFTPKPEQSAKVERVQQENSIKLQADKDIATPSFTQIKEQRWYDYDVTILSEEAAILSLQKVGIDSRMVYVSTASDLKYYQPFRGEKILIAANNDKQNKEYVSTINEVVQVLERKGAITSIVMPLEDKNFNEMLKNKGMIAVKELVIPEVIKLVKVEYQNIH